MLRQPLADLTRLPAEDVAAMLRGAARVLGEDAPGELLALAGALQADDLQEVARLTSVR
ncbi:hypothetical protein [Dactylosporangium sp. CA-139066]|uniref:hypothetical protein n=1 Tax=Dactylosporangium sp. CA-139066 TaxID=3239930 RepID=UPI003D9418DD